MSLSIKRSYEAPAASDGKRILIDRLWPRGLSKEKARIDLWMKEIAPSSDLRKWFGHDPEKWKEFQVRYKKELAANSELVDSIRKMAKRETVTLVYSAKDEEHNDAVVLAEVLRRGLPASKEDDAIGYERWVNEGGHVAPAAMLQRERGRLESAASD